MKENTTDKINLSKDDCDVDCKIVSTHDIIDPITLSILDTVPKGKLFDYGCGDCFLTKKVMQLGFDVIGFDVDTKTLLSARRKDSRLDVLTQNEFYRSPFEFRGKFDVVLCSLVVCVIEENRDLLQLFSNIASLIKPDGTLVLSLCNPRYTHVKRTKLQTKL